MKIGHNLHGRAGEFGTIDVVLESAPREHGGLQSVCGVNIVTAAIPVFAVHGSGHSKRGALKKFIAE